ncbi:hypothetical protein L596_006785 [Steinernema carpocapsae]|uniref:DM domain-containing protein n=1 Tax=Steinernema carpocapsae TaxID=34508 RepID=A0A4U5P6Y6_STECR|nr:hypothetical protein L596_006785 [Steinernema carpocapsae]
MASQLLVRFCPGDDTTSSSGTTCSSPELDVVGSEDIAEESQNTATSPNNAGATANEKRYLCQRCLNHGEEYPRKGHKPYCQYARCECSDCIMVEKRRQLNNQLSQRRLDPNAVRAPPGKKVRDPKCALCSAHGIKEPLKGHKKVTCPFNGCGCNLCELVDNRRRLMARQIKLRRVQQKTKKQQEMNGDGESKTSPKPLVIRSKSPEVGILVEQKSSPPPMEELPTPIPVRPFQNQNLQINPLQLNLNLMAAAQLNLNQTQLLLPTQLNAQLANPLASLPQMPLAMPPAAPELAVSPFGAPANPQIQAIWAQAILNQLVNSRF